ncbi:MAG: Franean1_4349 family RiPP [Methanomicrobiaceae archaeon]|nr:Franean1_4349 family RiPP [Methanomicrobiaceae archaeon]
MATEKEMYELIGRTVVDAEFRKKITENPEEAAKEAGYTLTDEQLAALKSADAKGIAAVLEERFPKSFGKII